MVCHEYHCPHHEPTNTSLMVYWRYWLILSLSHSHSFTLSSSISASRFFSCLFIHFDEGLIAFIIFTNIVWHGIASHQIHVYMYACECTACWDLNKQIVDLNCMDISNRGKIAHIRKRAQQTGSRIEKTKTKTKQKSLCRNSQHLCTICTEMNQWTVAAGIAINSDSFWKMHYINCRL